jgi:hypothetical protein
VSQENPGAKQTHYSSYSLKHCEYPLPALHARKHSGALHSQKDSTRLTHIAGEVRISRNRCFKRGRRTGREAESKPSASVHTFDSPQFHRRTSLPISAVFGLRYRPFLVRGVVARTWKSG